MSKKMTFEFDKESGVSMCFIKDKNGKVYTGCAQCHPDDEDMKSAFTGQTIAELRAQIAMMRGIRDNEVIPQLAALKHLQETMKTSKHYNPKSYEATMLRRQIKQKKGALNDIKTFISLRQDELATFLYEKEKCYEGIRRHRAEVAHEQGQN